jgi:phage tail sheath protein FI
MPANFLHGVETITLDSGAKPIRVVKSAVIGIVGTAPLYQVAAADQTVNKPVMVLSDVAGAQLFGSEKTAGYTIPKAIKAAFAKGAATVVVVNVFDPATHKTNVLAEAAKFGADDTLTLAHLGVANVTVKNLAGTITYIKDTDYTLDAVTGKITRIAAGAILAAADVKIDYDYADPSKVLAADIIGSVDGGGKRTGLQALLDCYSLFGFKAKIIVAPSFSTQNTVATEMVAIAGKVKGVTYIDAPIGTTVAQAIAGRGVAGTINFKTSSRRAMLCYPFLQVADATGATELQPYSQFLAGIRAWKDNEQGYWWSSSNTEIAGIVGIERPLTAEINDPTSEVNALNEVGITTVFNSFGSGFRTWGNRSAAWPAESGSETFEACLRTGDVVGDSIEYSMLQFLDSPINDAIIDAVTESVRGFMRKLVGDGAIIDGNCWYDQGDNPVTELAAGHATFRYDYMWPPTMERITFKRVLNLDYLKSLGGNQ